jgi:pyruvate kinase
MDYQIIATLGPRSQDEATWQAMLSAGASGFRLNTSHISIDDLRGWLGRLQPFLAGSSPRPSLTLDLQGSKWRLGQFIPFTLRRGQRVELLLAIETSQPAALPVPHPDFFNAAPSSSAELALDDARLLLHVESCSADRLTARVIQGGRILPRKGLTYRSSSYRLEQLNPKDQAVLELTRGSMNLRYAISYVRDAQEMGRYRLLCGSAAYQVAKLERQPALDDFFALADLADELWLCRGDLGAELGSRRMAEEVARISRLVSQSSRPVLLAGQVLEHLTRHSTPTRSELCCLHDALAGGYAGLVLSDETAIGRNPIEACRLAALFLDRSHRTL